MLDYLIKSGIMGYTAAAMSFSYAGKEVAKPKKDQRPFVIVLHTSIGITNAALAGLIRNMD